VIAAYSRRAFAASNFIQEPLSLKNPVLTTEFFKNVSRSSVGDSAPEPVTETSQFDLPAAPPADPGLAAGMLGLLALPVILGVGFLGFVLWFAHHEAEKP
jgi:hypothetical protein